MLEFHVSTILWTVVNLVVLYLFLRKFLFGRINAVLEQRQAQVQSSLDEAQAQKEQARAAREEYEEKLANARQEAARLVTDAQARAERVYQARVDEAERQARQLHAEAQARIGTEREAMLRGARSEVAALALLAASQVAQQSMDSAGERALVDSFLAEVGEDA